MQENTKQKDLLTLNHFIAQTGLCARRKATELIKEGEISVNGHIQKDPSYRVQAHDVVKYQQKKLVIQKLRYFLFNKPANVICSATDPLGKTTVMDLFRQKYKERLFTIGRLDYPTTGLIIVTNDGDLAQQLAHPKFSITKTYRVRVDKQVDFPDLLRMQRGVKLKDGFAKCDKATYYRKNKRVLEITIHSGKKRIIRRLCQAVGYTVIGLDRTGYAGLFKNKLPIGTWRPLKPIEIQKLKQLAQTKQ